MLEKTKIVILCIFLSGCADKVAHTIVGGALYPIDNSCKLALLAGVGKEVMDSRTHDPDFFDAAVTYLGCKILNIILEE